MNNGIQDLYYLFYATANAIAKEKDLNIRNYDHRFAMWAPCIICGDTSSNHTDRILHREGEEDVTHYFCMECKHDCGYYTIDDGWQLIPKKEESK